MKSIFKKPAFFFVPLFVFSLLIFSACPVQLKIANSFGAEFDVEFAATLNENLIEALQSIASVSQNSIASQNQNSQFDLSQIIDEKKIESELNSKYFSLSQIRFQNSPDKKSVKLNAKAKIKNIANFPKKLLSQKKLPSGKTRLSFSISPQILQETLLQNQTTLKVFAELLMAPLVTGEKMSHEEYAELLFEIYGQKVADELLLGEFAVTAIFPNGKSQSQKILIKDLLCSADELSFEFEY